MPWALKISEGPNRVAGTYHPTFLYESLWCIGAALLVIWADRRFKLGHGRVFALYVAAYCAGRAWIEYMRVDEAHHILGLRLNVWTALIVFVLAVVYFVISAKVRPGREEIVEPGAAEEAAQAEAAKDGGAGDAKSSENDGGAKFSKDDDTAESSKDDGAGRADDADADADKDADRTPEKNGTAKAAKNG